MIGHFPHEEEFRALLDALCDESISDAEVRRLEQIVLSHPEAEALYVQHMGLFAELAQQVGHTPRLNELQLCRRLPPAALRDLTLESATASRRTPRVPGRHAWVVLAVSAAASIALLVIPAARRFPAVDPSTPAGAAHTAANEPLDNTVAVLFSSQGAEWGPTELPTSTGSALSPGRLQLKAGFAQIDFYSGATIVLEGPADFELISPMEAYCARGKLRVLVPPHAQGFTIGSPRLDLIDRGTEFGLHVEADDQTEVHVFQGVVDVYDVVSGAPTPDPVRLTTGQALRLMNAATRPIAADTAAFLGPQELALRSAADARRRQRDWQSAALAVQQDPALILYFDFQSVEPWSRTLPNRARRLDSSSDGALVGCTWSAGRWAGRQALQFSQVSDRVRVHVPGEFDALTLAAWVRVDGLPNPFNSLFMTDSWDAQEPHWHISAAGMLELGVQGPARSNGAHYYSPIVVTPSEFGRWRHLAVTYDRSTSQVVHYVDGEPVSSEPLLSDRSLTIGSAEIGNWNVTTRPHNHPIRYFQGCLDEFLLLARALSPVEIGELYHAGRPQ